MRISTGQTIPPLAGQGLTQQLGWLFVLAAAIGLPYATLRYAAPARRNKRD